MLKLGLLAENMHRSVLPGAYAFIGERLGVSSSFELANTPPTQLSETVERLRQTLDGFTVTMPYKKEILRFCDEQDVTAQKCGSANTICIRNGRMIAYNTDGWGLMRFLETVGHRFDERRVTMVGAGGVACSIAYQLSIRKVKDVRLINVDLPAAQALATRMGACFSAYPLDDEHLVSCSRGADFFINASVLGQLGFPDYEDLSFLKELAPNAVVYDVNYSNPDAKLVCAAGQWGHIAYTGRSMSACQGLRAMEIWTGRQTSEEDAQALILWART